ncbi:MAG TPA: hypothetical protein V6C85_20900 [Allocoleopsis sp.]
MLAIGMLKDRHLLHNLTDEEFTAVRRKNQGCLFFRLTKAVGFQAW